MLIAHFESVLLFKMLEIYLIDDDDILAGCSTELNVSESR